MDLLHISEDHYYPKAIIINKQPQIAIV